jgi:hypothetical protein
MANPMQKFQEMLAKKKGKQEAPPAKGKAPVAAKGGFPPKKGAMPSKKGC